MGVAGLLRAFILALLLNEFDNCDMSEKTREEERVLASLINELEDQANHQVQNSVNYGEDEPTVVSEISVAKFA